jgi:hypothetical protein
VLLLADGIEAGRQEIALPAVGGTVELAWPLPPGASDATVVLEVADAFAADNRADLPWPRATSRCGSCSSPMSPPRSPGSWRRSRGRG